MSKSTKKSKSTTKVEIDKKGQKLTLCADGATVPLPVVRRLRHDGQELHRRLHQLRLLVHMYIHRFWLAWVKTFIWFNFHLVYRKNFGKIEILGGKVLKNNFPCKFLACPGQNLCVQGADV
jgi:hypothetical protein